jgi:hypothetical protein
MINKSSTLTSVGKKLLRLFLTEPVKPPKKITGEATVPH